MTAAYRQSARRNKAGGAQFAGWAGAEAPGAAEAAGAVEAAGLAPGLGFRPGAGISGSGPRPVATGAEEPPALPSGCAAVAFGSRPSGQ